MGDQPAALIGFDADEACLTVVLDVGRGLVAVQVGLPPMAARVLHDVYALDANAGACPHSVARHADLVLRCVAARGVLACDLIVRDGPPAVFDLRLWCPPASERALTLTMVDGVCLLLSRRLPVIFHDGSAPDELMPELAAAAAKLAGGA